MITLVCGLLCGHRGELPYAVVDELGGGGPWFAWCGRCGLVQLVTLVPAVGYAAGS